MLISVSTRQTRPIGKLAFLVGALLAIAALAGCSGAGSEEQTSRRGPPGTADARAGRQQQRDVAAVPVETALARTGEISSYLNFNSTLETETAVDIFPQVGGRVEALYVEEGDSVEAGQVLLRLEDDELQVELREREINLTELEAAFKRTEPLFESNLINEQEYETRKFQLEEARLQVERARVRLAHTVVRAPVSGVITERPPQTQLGARVATGTKLFTMMNLDEMIARVFVPGKYLTTIAEDQPATLSSDFVPDQQFNGWVKRISPTVDPRSGTFKVTVGVRGNHQTLLPGLFVNVRLVTDTHENAVLLPKQAVVYEGGQRYVFVVKDQRAQKVRLESGYEDGNFVEALSGIQPGTPVIVLGQNGLKDDALVKVVNGERAETPEPLILSGE